MNTLLLRICGAMQSWGLQSRFSVRDTALEPTKSGVLGLVCAALGIDRQDDHQLAELATMRMGVRADREGVMRVDYHTASNVQKASGGIKATELSRRYYLADACFIVGLESGDLTLLERVHRALHRPMWPLFLGRKSFVPDMPIWLEDGLKTGQDLRQALTAYEYQGRPPAPLRLRLLVEDPAGPIVRQDQPLSFAHGQRRFTQRRLSAGFTPTPQLTPEAL